MDYSAESDLSAEEASTKTAEAALKESEELAAVRKEREKERMRENLQAIKDNVDTQSVSGTHKRYSSHKEFADRRKDVVSARLVPVVQLFSSCLSENFKGNLKKF